LSWLGRYWVGIEERTGPDVLTDARPLRFSLSRRHGKDARRDGAPLLQTHLAKP
jgi:hypothetical protein